MLQCTHKIDDILEMLLAYTYMIGHLVKSAFQNFFSYFSTKTYVVGTQKISLNETVLLSTQNKCLN